MNQQQIDKISGAIGTLILMIFVLGLAESITSGFAGFWGGLPFWVIALATLVFVVYDYWDSCLRPKK